MEPHEVVARVSSVGAQDFSKFPLRAIDLDDLSAAELARFREPAATRFLPIFPTSTSWARWTSSEVRAS